jgi:hypothetical protein
MGWYYTGEEADKVIEATEARPMDFVEHPEVLTHPNIPIPLHGLNPRTIKGDKWWDKTRKEAYAATNDHCFACGIHKSNARGRKWMEGHEYWNIDYQAGKCVVEKIIPLCHYCHNFIHSGRLSMIAGKDKTYREVIDILEHGFGILKKNGLKCFGNTRSLALDLGADTFGVEEYENRINPNIRWQDWVLVLEGVEYHSLFANEGAWRDHYGMEPLWCGHDAGWDGR